jgi:hypothetical protein
LTGTRGDGGDDDDDEHDDESEHQVPPNGTIARLIK